MRTYQSRPIRSTYLPSRTFICMRCGEAWAKVDSGNEWIAYRGICEACPPLEGWLPGSIYDGLRADFNTSLPLEAWLREVEIHCRWAEKGEANE